MTPDLAALDDLRRTVRPMLPELRAIAIVRSGLLPAPRFNDDGSVDVPSLKIPGHWRTVTADGICDCGIEWGSKYPCWHASYAEAYSDYHAPDTAPDAFDIIPTRRPLPVSDDAFTDTGIGYHPARRQLFRSDVA